MRLLIINGSYHGNEGQSGIISKHIIKNYGHIWHEVSELVLKTQQNKEEWQKEVQTADAFIFITGTYWDSWGSPLQIFLEETTPWEAGPLWVGKVFGVVVTEHCTGGKGILSRLQGVLNTLGLFAPPLSSMVYSLSSQMAMEQSYESQEVRKDFWSLSDLDIVLHNIHLAARASLALREAWKIWPVDHESTHEIWVNLD